MRLACAEDFESPDGLYWPPYADVPAFELRAEWIGRHWPGASVLIVGCAYGYTVRHARRQGLNVDGLDFSDWALARKVDDHVFKMNAANMSHWAKLLSRTQYDVVLTEDIAPMLSPRENDVMRDGCHLVADIVVHAVTPAPYTPTHPSIQMVLELEGWVAKFDGDLVIHTGEMQA